jgi:hypothetical protein
VAEGDGDEGSGLKARGEEGDSRGAERGGDTIAECCGRFHPRLCSWLSQPPARFEQGAVSPQPVAVRAPASLLHGSCMLSRRPPAVGGRRGRAEPSINK